MVAWTQVVTTEIRENAKEVSGLSELRQEPTLHNPALLLY